MPFLHAFNRTAQAYLLSEDKPDIVLSLANAVFSGTASFQTVQKVSPTSSPQIQIKGTLSDTHIALLQDDKDRTCVVQIQFSRLHWGINRCSMFIEEDYLRNVEQPHFWYSNRPYFVLVFTEFEIENTAGYLHSVTYHHSESQLPLHICLIDLKRFDKQKNACATLLDQWLFFLKNSPKLRATPKFVKDEGLKQAYTTLDANNWSKIDFRSYRESEDRVDERQIGIWYYYVTNKAALHPDYNMESPPSATINFYQIEKILGLTRKFKWRDMNVSAVEEQIPSLAFEMFRQWTQHIKKHKPKLDLTIVNEQIIVKDFREAVQHSLASLFESVGYHTNPRDWSIGYVNGHIQGQLQVCWHYEYIAKQSETYKTFAALRVLSEFLKFDKVLELRLDALYTEFVAQNSNLADLKAEVAIQELMIDEKLDMKSSNEKGKIAAILDNLAQKYILKVAKSDDRAKDFSPDNLISDAMFDILIEQNRL